MRTENQKRARRLLQEMGCVYVIPLGTNRSDYRANINGEPYLTVGSLDAPLGKLKRWAKNHGWAALDMFPISVDSFEYGAVSHLVRVAALESGGEDMMEYLYTDELGRRRHKEAIILSKNPWPTENEDWRFRPITKTEEDCRKNIELWKERCKLIYAKDEPQDPDIDTCIRVLKAAGYKIQKSIIKYEEI